MDRTSHKSVKAALAYVPPVELWEKIQEVRYIYDKHVDRWPPHMNFFFPFADEGFTEECLPLLVDTLKDVEPFEATAVGYEALRVKKNNFVLYLRFEPKQKFLDLYSRLADALPFCINQNHDFLPHMTVGTFERLSDLTAAKTYLAKEFEKFVVPVNALHILFRDDESPFFVKFTLPFGGGCALEQELFEGEPGVPRPEDAVKREFEVPTLEEYQRVGGMKTKRVVLKDLETEAPAAAPEKPKKDEKKKKKKYQAPPMEKKERLHTSKEVFDRIQWDSTYNKGAVTVCYEDRFLGMIEVPFLEFETSEIPFHRIYLFKQNDTVIWDRNARVDHVFTK